MIDGGFERNADVPCLISYSPGSRTVYPMVNRYTALLSSLVLLCGLPTQAHAYDALQVCRDQSPLTDDIHSCLDNYLDLMDRNLGDLTIYIDGELRGRERAAFNRAQNSFYSYRRENCLWYLEIGGPRVEAEQVAKNCLADMSQNRLAELQSLIASYQNPGINDPAIDPLSATADSEATENEALASNPEANEQTSEGASESATESANAEDANAGGLSAYLGQWQVTCTDSGSKRCTIDVPLEPLSGESSGSIMRVIRRTNERSIVELHFPGVEISSPDKISWRVDNYSFGAVPGSIISVKADMLRQIINERKFLRDDLMPLFRSGSEVGITVLAEVDGSEGEEYEATLLGFSRAVTFADEFIEGEL